MSRHARVLIGLLAVVLALSACKDKEDKNEAEASAGSASEHSDADAVGRDLLRLCEIATEVRADASIPDPDKPGMIAARFTETDVDPETLQLLETLSMRDPATRYPLLVAAATTHGVVDFACPALDERP